MRLQWSEWEDRSLEELRSGIIADAKQVRYVTLHDLVAPTPEGSTGLYFFVADSSFEYIGKAGSRAIIERVPAHLDTRETGWFGTLLRRLGEHTREGMTRAEALPNALDLRIAVLFKDVAMVDSAALGRVETKLRRIWQPRLNPDRRALTFHGSFRALVNS